MDNFICLWHTMEEHRDLYFNYYKVVAALKEKSDKTNEDAFNILTEHMWNETIVEKVETIATRMMSDLSQKGIVVSQEMLPYIWLQAYNYIALQKRLFKKNNALGLLLQNWHNADGKGESDDEFVDRMWKMQKKDVQLYTDFLKQFGMDNFLSYYRPWSDMLNVLMNMKILGINYTTLAHHVRMLKQKNDSLDKENKDLIANLSRYETIKEIFYQSLLKSNIRKQTTSTFYTFRDWMSTGYSNKELGHEKYTEALLCMEYWLQVWLLDKEGYTTILQIMSNDYTDYKNGNPNLENKVTNALADTYYEKYHYAYMINNMHSSTE